MRAHSFPAVALVAVLCTAFFGNFNGTPAGPAIVLEQKSGDPLVKMPSGEPVRIFEVGSFERVSIGSILNAIVRTGDRTSVAAYGPAEMVEHLKVKESSDGIAISMDLPEGMKMKKNEDVVLVITTPQLSELDASGITKVVIESMRTEEFDLTLSGISEAQLQIACTDLEVDLSGTAIAEINGETGKLDAGVSGASQLHALALQCREASVDASGASSIELHVKEKLQADASGASNVKYTGSPAEVEVNSTGMAMINVLSN